MIYTAKSAENSSSKVFYPNVVQKFICDSSSAGRKRNLSSVINVNL